MEGSRDDIGGEMIELRGEMGDEEKKKKNEAFSKLPNSLQMGILAMGAQRGPTRTDRIQRKIENIKCFIGLHKKRKPTREEIINHRSEWCSRCNKYV